MTEKPFNYDYVGGYTLDEQAEAELIAAQNECTFMWSTREGWPVGVIMSYIFEQGCFWLSVSSLRVRVQAPPVEGAANDDVVAVIAEALGVAARSVHIAAGHSARQKLVDVDSIDAAAAQARLLAR